MVMKLAIHLITHTGANWSPRSFVSLRSGHIVIVHRWSLPSLDSPRAPITPRQSFLCLGPQHPCRSFCRAGPSKRARRGPRFGVLPKKSVSYPTYIYILDDPKPPKLPSSQNRNELLHTKLGAKNQDSSGSR